MTDASWLSPKEFALRKKVSEKTVYRRINAGEIEAKKEGRLWRILETESDHPNQRDDQAHQSVLLDILGSASMEVGPYINSFPAVYGWSYSIDDPSNAFIRSTVSGRPHVELRLVVEGEHAWRYAYAHLETGFPHTLAALKTVKQSFGLYWQILCDLEDQLRAEVGELVAKEGHSVQIDDSNFFRWILSEVDKPQSTPSLDDYEVRTHRTRVSVVKVVSAPNEDLARKWMKRHLEWRKAFVMNDRESLHLLRSEVQLSAKQFTDAIGDLQVAGRLPCLCAKCDPGRVAQET